ncbi:hypothetical protein KVG96_08245 [Pseudomonas sp. COR58]|uniref:Uncharacterized protein n=1 Tax=Pseudomonas ekonensis TaxID=2842353 RepID=A0ABS6PBT9_9PSED|nr:hypothetical protein [Pseudomonas ekonensis]MBV4457932.1 hypothetical protein [Pseudomonas ekonensis]
MLQNNRKNLELDKLQVEIQKLGAERSKLMAEEKKLTWEATLYPLAVGAGMLTALVAALGLLFKP